MTVINISTRVRFVNPDGTLTPEAYRSLYEIIERTGGMLGSACGDTLGDVTASTQPQALAETVAQPLTDWPALDGMTTQSASESQPLDMVMQPASEVLTFDLPRHATASAPAYAKGRMYFDTTMNKARIGGATAYETITSI